MEKECIVIIITNINPKISLHIKGNSLHIGTLENTGVVVGKEGNSTFKIDSYIGKDIQNHDTMKTTGGSIGISTGKPRITNVGFNQESRDKEGITRNTVVGNVEIGQSSGDEINRDLGKANEVTKDKQHSTNINVESQTIEYVSNPTKFKEDLDKAKNEIKDVTKALDNSIHDPGDDNRNFFGQLRETRLSETVENIAGERLKVASTQNEIKSAFEEAYSDLGYKAEIKFSTPEETPELKDKAGTAYVSSTGVHTMIININAKENSTKSGLIGTISEEGSHIINGAKGRQIETGTEEKGLESTGRATNSYFQDKYRDDKTTISMKSDGTIDTSKLGINVGDKLYLSVGTEKKLNNLRNKKREKIVKDFIDMLKENNLDITGLEDLLLKKNQDRNLFKEMTSAEKLEFLNYYKGKSLDELGIELEEGTNAEKIIIKKKKDLDKLGLALDDPRRIFTEAIRDIIETKEIDNIIQITDNADIIKKIEDTQNINYNWKSWISAVNYREKDFSGNVIFYNLVQPDAKYGYYKLDGTFISENSKDAKIISQNASKAHELIAHPRDYAIQRKNNGQLNYIKLPQERFIETSINGKKVVYLENQYIHLNKLPKINNGWRIANDDLSFNLKKNKENNIKYFFKPAAYIVQPFYQDESTTLIFEKMVNDQDFGERPENRRFYYSESLKGYELRFETLEDLRNYFKKNGSERK